MESSSRRSSPPVSPSAQSAENSSTAAQRRSRYYPSLTSVVEANANPDVVVEAEDVDDEERQLLLAIQLSLRECNANSDNSSSIQSKEPIDAGVGKGDGIGSIDMECKSTSSRPRSPASSSDQQRSYMKSASGSSPSSGTSSRDRSAESSGWNPRPPSPPIISPDYVFSDDEDEYDDTWGKFNKFVQTYASGEQRNHTVRKMKPGKQESKHDSMPLPPPPMRASKEPETTESPGTGSWSGLSLVDKIERALRSPPGVAFTGSSASSSQRRKSLNEKKSDQSESSLVNYELHDQEENTHGNTNNIFKSINQQSQDNICEQKEEMYSDNEEVKKIGFENQDVKVCEISYKSTDIICTDTPFIPNTTVSSSVVPQAVQTNSNKLNHETLSNEIK